MRTFHISTLGCKVNQYESEQIATLLRSRGLLPADRPEQADLRIVNTCSVTIQAASKSRQTVRQVVRLPVLRDTGATSPADPAPRDLSPPSADQRIIVTGCWATSDKATASKLPGVSAVIGHHENVADELGRLLSLWQTNELSNPANTPNPLLNGTATKTAQDNEWMILASAPAVDSIGANDNKASRGGEVNDKIENKSDEATERRSDEGGWEGEARPGTHALPLLDSRQTSHQRAFLKIQDGCDAHCTYCIIPTLRPGLWSKPVDAVVEEAQRLVAVGHAELVLTGIFLGAYAQPTALRRRQGGAMGKPLAQLLDALCTRVRGLRRLRLSSLEPGDLDDALIAVMRAHPQCVPHFHLPLQSGSDAILRKMNRQYTRDDFLRMVEQVHAAFDRPAITTDIIVGFPGETDEAFEETVRVAGQSGFIHIHAFPFSPRPGTAAARWKSQFIHGPIVNERIARLNAIASAHSLQYRRQFIGQTVEILVEHPDAEDHRHGTQQRAI